MKTKGSALLLLALLIGLPGCGNKDGDKAKKPAKAAKVKKNNKKMAEGERTDAELLAEADDSLASFFEMDDLVAFTDEDLAWDQDAEGQLETCYFDFGKDAVGEDQAEKVTYNADRVKELLAKAQEEDASAQLVVEGHSCHSAGSEGYNRKLSEQRAQKVAQKLVEAGIPADSLRVVGRGVEMPVVEEGDRDEQWANRRVELHVVHA